MRRAELVHVAVVGGSDAGIEAARRCRELAPEVEVTVLVADGYPNLSICGLPYWRSREVLRWQDLAHRTVADLEATGMRLLLDHEVTALDLDARTLTFTRVGAGAEHQPVEPERPRGAYGAEVSKRVDVLAVAIGHGATVAGLSDLDLSYTPPLAAPWEALEQAAHVWAAQEDW